jgi:hypothetical protein
MPMKVANASFSHSPFHTAWSPIAEPHVGVLVGDDVGTLPRSACVAVAGSTSRASRGR